MAIRALNSTIVANYDTAAAASWLAGAALVRDYSNAGRVVIGTRSALGSSTGFVGFSSDDTARTGNTMIIADPVGSSYTDASGNFQANNNGFYAVSKRAIGDFLAENVNRPWCLEQDVASTLSIGDVVMSWWLSPVVQHFIDLQMCESFNDNSLRQIFEGLKRRLPT